MIASHTMNVQIPPAAISLPQASPNLRKIFQRDAVGHVLGYIDRRDGVDLIFKKVAWPAIDSANPDVIVRAYVAAVESPRSSGRAGRQITMRVLGLARALVALSSAGLAILGLAYRDFAPLAQALPTVTPGRETWLYASAWLLLVASALCFFRTPLPGVLIIGVYEAAWAATSTPQILSNPLSVGAWYGFCEAMSSLVAPAILYATYRSEASAPAVPFSTERIMHAARIVFGLTCVFYGYSHFAYADYTASMVPTWLPGRLVFAYLTGLAHIAAGIGLVVGYLPRLAATLEALMMSLFGLLVWVPSFFAQPTPKWATPPGNQLSELVVTLLLATSAWLIAASLSKRP